MSSKTANSSLILDTRPHLVHSKSGIFMRDGPYTVAHAPVVLWSPRINVGCTSYKYSVDVLTSCFYSAQCPMVVTNSYYLKCLVEFGALRGGYGAPRPRGDRGLTFALSTVVCYRTARYIALCGGQWRWFAVSKFGYSAVFLASWLSAYYLTTIEAGP